MLTVFSNVLSIFLMILVGFIANRVHILKDDSVGPITNLMLYVTAPCMVMSSIYSKELSADVINATLQVMIGAVGFFIVATLISLLIVKIFRLKPKENCGLYITAMTTINSGFMGFPVTKAIFGGNPFYLMVMHNIILTIYMYVIVPPILKLGEPTKLDIKKILKSMCNIVLVAVVIGVVMLILGVKPPTVIDDVVQSLSDATIPLSMLLVGIQLGSSNLTAILKNKTFFIINLAAMILIPAVTFLIIAPMDFLYTDVKVVIIFASVFPTAVAPVAIAEQEGKDSKSLAEIVSLTTFTSLITVPLFAAFLTSYFY